MLMCKRAVMIIDDDRDILGIIRCALEAYGYAVFVYEKATEALGRAMTVPCEYVITDYEMPGMNGLDVTRRLRALLPAAIIIGMSGKDMNVPFLTAGANDFIQKPFVPCDLVRMIGGGDLSC